MGEQTQSSQSKRYKVRPIIWAGGFAIVCLAFLISAIDYVLTPQHHHPPIQPESVVRTLVQAMVIYAGEHDDMFPDRDNWEQILLAQGLPGNDPLVSSAEDGDGVSYIFVPGPFSFDSTQILLYEDPKHFQDGVLVGFADTHVEMIDHETFELMLAEQLAAQNQSP